MRVEAHMEVAVPIRLGDRHLDVEFVWRLATQPRVEVPWPSEAARGRG